MYVFCCKKTPRTLSIKSVSDSVRHRSTKKEAPPPLPSSSPPPAAPIPPLTPPLRPAPSSPKWGDPDYKHGGRSGLSQRKATSGTPSPSDQVNPSDLNNATPPASPRHNAGSPASPSPLSSHEQTITIHKDNLHLGLTLEAVDKAVNGCAVKTIARPSAAQVDGRLQPGDLILSVNNESLRRITSAQARAILRRCSLLGTDISVTSVHVTRVRSLNISLAQPRTY
ncbi:hypothetical protein RRG08_053975 [Elysia crispata]|uniref:PDZ domain-containing protein n=1 Tax=Elysia crispata TaxID=231223 RepID=A0AAE0ZGB1_9GAST|nr:hypothetical protein RRG08_053975 [Elysia crispata]